MNAPNGPATLALHELSEDDKNAFVQRPGSGLANGFVQTSHQAHDSLDRIATTPKNTNTLLPNRAELRQRAQGAQSRQSARTYDSLDPITTTPLNTNKTLPNRAESLRRAPSYHDARVDISTRSSKFPPEYYQSMYSEQEDLGGQFYPPGIGPHDLPDSPVDEEKYQSLRSVLMPDWASIPKTSAISSASSSRMTYTSGLTILSNRSYYSARSGSSRISGVYPYQSKALKELEEIDEYAQLLQSKNLWPVDPQIEENWSGRGQHAKFDLDERKVLDEILQVQETLGSTSSSVVQSVKCRRILLARKSIQCKRKMNKAWALQEVAHLTRLNHSHVVRVIGTYTMGRELSILVYPVADYNLHEFLDVINAAIVGETTWHDMITSCLKFFRCLSSAVEHIHNNTMKHMDIKPANILVRKLRKDGTSSVKEFKVYIADFGIAKAYKSIAAVETDGPTSFTRKYASPEVTNQELRGFAADIFSLGCVFLEIFVTMVDAAVSTRMEGRDELAPRLLHTSQHADLMKHKAVDKLQKCLRDNTRNDASYQANLLAINCLIKKISAGFRDDKTIMGWLSHLIPEMLHPLPKKRPTANELPTHLNGRCFHTEGCEPLALPVVMSEDDSSANEDPIPRTSPSIEARNIVIPAPLTPREGVGHVNAVDDPLKSAFQRMRAAALEQSKKPLIITDGSTRPPSR